MGHRPQRGGGRATAKERDSREAKPGRLDSAGLLPPSSLGSRAATIQPLVASLAKVRRRAGVYRLIANGKIDIRLSVNVGPWNGRCSVRFRPHETKGKTPVSQLTPVPIHLLSLRG